MNRISTFSVKKLAFSVLAMLLFSSAWAQRLSGDGSEETPYLIESADDWNEFATMINGGNGLTAYYKLTADVTIGSEQHPTSTMVGTNRYRFKGHFDGDWHTLTVYIRQTTADVAGPFAYVESASICNLKVAGTITISKKYAGGIVGYSYASAQVPTSFINCTSSIHIVSSIIGDGTHGGFVGKSDSGSMTLDHCLFDGSITGEHTNKCAGFLGWSNGPVTYTDCLMAGTLSIEPQTDLIATFHRCRNENGTYIRAYYLNNYGGNQGTLPPTSAPENIYKIYNHQYYIAGNVIGLEQTYYEYTSGTITITPTAAFFGTKLIWNTDYTISVNGQNTNSGSINITSAGVYNVSVNGIGGYSGSYETTINVTQGDISDWVTLNSVLSTPGNKTITLAANGNFTAQDQPALTIPARSEVTLDLNGNTLNRNLTSATAEGYVIHVNSNATLILSNGTVRGGNNNGNGGGIYNEGTLHMTDVIVTGNHANKTNNVWGTGGGIYNAAGSNFSMENGSITNNSAYGGGGGIHGAGVNNFSMDGVTVSHNSATSKGGGVRLKTSGSLLCSISNCTITSNSLPNNDDQAMGGGIYLEGPNNANVQISASTISNNSANQNGGGVYLALGSATFTNCNIKENTAHVSGGGIYFYAGTLYVYGTTTIGGSGSNTSTSDGGGVYVRGNNKMHIKGTPIISDNDGNSVVQNVYLESTSNVIYVDGLLSANANIGVTRIGHGEGTITHGLTESGNQNPYNFFSDYSEHAVILHEGEAYLGIDPNPNTFRHSGDWNDAANWSKGLPDEGDEVWIRASATIPNGYTANVGDIDAQGGEIFIADGGQLIHSNTGVVATVLKTVSGYSNSQKSKSDKWYFIASPIIDDQNANQVKELIPLQGDGDYDLYKFDESQNGSQWWNYKADPFDIQHTNGYLYAREVSNTLQFSGKLQPAGAGPVAVELAYTSDKTLAGWNLVGNPFPCNAYASMPYYVMNENGNGFTSKTVNDAIPPCTGILVHTDRTGQSITFSKDSGNTPNRGRLEVALAKTDTREAVEQDNAVVSFNQGEELPKFVFSENNAKIYIPQGRDDYAIVGSDKKGEMPVHFKAVEDGTYSITVNPKDVEMDYLHLIDNSTHADIDLLAEPSYSFSATTTDAESRFKLVFRASDNEEETNRSFAFINNGQIILFDVEKEGTLQVIDLLGHVIFSGNAEQTVSVAGMPTGVYVLRLLQGEHTLTQKIVIQN